MRMEDFELVPEKPLVRPIVVIGGPLDRFDLEPFPHQNVPNGSTNLHSPIIPSKQIQPKDIHALPRRIVPGVNKKRKGKKRKAMKKENPSKPRSWLDRIPIVRHLYRLWIAFQTEFSLPVIQMYGLLSPKVKLLQGLKKASNSVGIRGKWLSYLVALGVQGHHNLAWNCFLADMLILKNPFILYLMFHIVGILFLLKPLLFESCREETQNMSKEKTFSDYYAAFQTQFNKHGPILFLTIGIYLASASKQSFWFLYIGGLSFLFVIGWVIKQFLCGSKTNTTLPNDPDPDPVKEISQRRGLRWKTWNTNNDHFSTWIFVKTCTGVALQFVEKFSWIPLTEQEESSTDVCQGTRLTWSIQTYDIIDISPLVVMLIAGSWPKAFQCTLEAGLSVILTLFTGLFIGFTQLERLV